MQIRSKFDGIMQFVSLNREIPQLLSEINENPPELKALVTAINEGDCSAVIFSDPKCYIYLLYAIKNELIPFESAMTTYGYLLALIQFTEKQPIRESDLPTRDIRNVEVLNTVLENKLVDTAKAYLKGCCERFAILNYKIDYEELCQFVLQLPAIERSIIKIDATDSLQDWDGLFFALNINMPFIHKHIDESTSHVQYWIPSNSLIEFFLKKISNQPFKMLPCYGSVKPSTYETLHQQGFHPVALYAYHVKSNPIYADRFKPGPFLIWLHDIGHTFWASMFTHDEIYQIFFGFIPILKNLKNQAESKNASEEAAIYQDGIIKAADLDLTMVHDFSNSKIRLFKYLNRIIHHLESSLNRKIPELADNELKKIFKMKAPKNDLWTKPVVSAGVEAAVNGAGLYSVVKSQTLNSNTDEYKFAM